MISNSEVGQLAKRFGRVVRETAGTSRTERKKLWKRMIEDPKKFLTLPEGREKEMVTELSEGAFGVK